MNSKQVLAEDVVDFVSRLRCHYLDRHDDLKDFKPNELHIVPAELKMNDFGGGNLALSVRSYLVMWRWVRNES